MSEPYPSIGMQRLLALVQQHEMLGIQAIDGFKRAFVEATSLDPEDAELVVLEADLRQPDGSRVVFRHMFFQKKVPQ